MAQYLAEELLNSEGEPVKKTRAIVKKRPRKANKKIKDNTVPLDDTDSSDDSDFVSGSSGSDSPVDTSNEPQALTNAEVCGATICLLVM